MSRVWDLLALSRERGHDGGLAEDGEWSVASAVGWRVTSFT